MKKTHKEIISREIEVLDGYFCDRCGGEIDTGGSFEYWNSRFHITQGNHYPEGDFREVEEAHFCESCAYDIKQILIDNGVTFEERDYDN